MTKVTLSMYLNIMEIMIFYKFNKIKKNSPNCKKYQITLINFRYIHFIHLSFRCIVNFSSQDKESEIK